MDENEPMQSGETDEDVEAQLLSFVKKIVPAVRTARNVTKVVRRLSSIGTNTVIAALEAKTSRLQLERTRNEWLIAQLAQLPSGRSPVGLKVAERLLDEQHRVDQVVFAALQQVLDSDDSPLAESGGDEVDDDWIESFRREAVDRSQSEMRETFVRILAGEVRQPGTFSIRTLRTVGALSQSTASLFQRAASLRIGAERTVHWPGGETRLEIFDARIPALDGQLGDNCLRAEGLDYERLSELTENGLLHASYTSWYGYDAAIPREDGGLRLPLVHQNRKWALVPGQGYKMESPFKVTGAEFTTVGKELLHIVDMKKDDAFLNKVQAYFRGRHLEMVALPSTTEQ